MNFPPIRNPRELPTAGESTPDAPTIPAQHDDAELPLLDDPLTVILGAADFADTAGLPEAGKPSTAELQAMDRSKAEPIDGAAPAEAAPRDDEPIPMLTEVMQVPRYEAEDIPQNFADVDWGELAQKVRENVLERLLRRSDALLDSQIQATLTPVLERAAEAVAQEMHDAMTRMIRDVVARAVTEELTRLHAEIARRNRTNPNRPR